MGTLFLAASLVVGTGGCAKKDRTSREEPRKVEPPPGPQPADATPFACPKEGPVEFCGQTFARGALNASCVNQEVSDLRPLSCLPELRMLRLFVVPVTDLSPISGLGKLEDLSLTHIDVRDIEVVRNFPNLKTIELHSVEVDNLAPLAALHSLRYVTLENLPARDLSPLAGHDKLQMLTLTFMDLPDLTVLSTLPIESLDLDVSNVADLSPVATIATLEELNIDAAVIPSGQLEMLRKHLPGLKLIGKPGTAENRAEVGAGLYPARGWKVAWDAMASSRHQR